MNRRSFLRVFGLAGAAVVAAPAILAEATQPKIEPDGWVPIPSHDAWRNKQTGDMVSGQEIHLALHNEYRPVPLSEMDAILKEHMLPHICNSLYGGRTYVSASQSRMLQTRTKTRVT